MKVLFLYLIISLLFIMALLLHLYDYQFAGYWTEKIIAWIWIIHTIFILIYHWKSKITKTYLLLLSIILILSLLPMGILFFDFLNFVGTFGDYQRLSINNKYRLEITQHQPLSMPRIYIYQKYHIIFEKLISRPIFYKVIKQTTELTHSQFNDKTISIQQAILIQHNSQTITIRYHIKDKEMIISHDDCFFNHQIINQNNSLDCGR